MRKTRWVCCDFKQDVTRFTEVDGIKVLAVFDFGHLFPETSHVLLPRLVIGVIFRTPSNVVHSPNPHRPDHSSDHLHVNRVADGSGRCKPHIVPILSRS